MLIFISKDTFLNVYQTTQTFEHTLVSSEKMQPRIIMPLFLSLPPKQAPQIVHPGILASPPPPKPIVLNQIPTLPTPPSTNTSIDSKSLDKERIRQLEVTIRNLTNKLTLQERKN